jgi:hypothetical protein
MSRNLQAVQPTPAAGRGWPSMAAASAGICRSSRALGRTSAGTSTVLSLVMADSVVDDVLDAEAPREFTAVARLEGQIVITVSPIGRGEPITLTLPVTASLPSAGRGIPAGTAEE